MIIAITNPREPLDKLLTLIAVSKIPGYTNQLYPCIPLPIKYNQLYITDNNQISKAQY